ISGFSHPETKCRFASYFKDERHTAQRSYRRIDSGVLLTLTNLRSMVMPLISSGLTLPRPENGRSVKTKLISTCSSPYLASNRSTRRTVKALSPSEANFASLTACPQVCRLLRFYHLAQPNFH